MYNKKIGFKKIFIIKNILKIMTEKEQAYKVFLNELKKIALNKNLKNLKSIDSLNEAFDNFKKARIHENKMLNKNNATFGLMNYIMESNLEKLLKSDKKLIKEYIDLVHGDKNLSAQYMLINSLNNYSLDNEGKNYINETLSLINTKLNRKTINESNLKLYKFLKKNNIINENIDKEIRNLYKNCDYIIKNEKKVSNLNDISKSINEIADYVEKHKKVITENAKNIKSLDKALNEYNIKYSKILNEDEKELIKEIFNAPETKSAKKEKLFNNLRNECVGIVNKLIEENANNDKEKLLSLKEGLLNMGYQDESLIQDIARLLEMKEVLSEK